jgi:isochorismate synthase
MSDELLARAKTHLEKELPFVLYSKPREFILNAIFQVDDTIHKVTDYTEQGFVFAPFLNDEKPILLKSKESFKAPLELTLNKTANVNGNALSDSDEEARYSDLVENAILEIRAGIYKKIVLSRSIKVPFSKPVLITFQELLSTYPNAFCYLWYHPKVGMWLGATPEILVKTSGLNFTTMSLAGTQNQTIGEELPKWATKEIVEQQLVTDYISEVLKSRAKEVKVANAETIKAGHLWHLRSKITGRFKQGMLKDLVTALHPTPAVCGMPLADAKRFIQDNEKYQRSYYTGFLGELNYTEERTRNRNRRNQENSAYRAVVRTSELYVNLRCMQKVGDSFVIYVGGGITADSDPKKEWRETESKAQTMLRLLTT